MAHAVRAGATSSSAPCAAAVQASARSTPVTWCQQALHAGWEHASVRSGTLLTAWAQLAWSGVPRISSGVQAADKIKGQLLEVSDRNDAALVEAQQGVRDSAAAETDAQHATVEAARKRSTARAKMQR